MIFLLLGYFLSWTCYKAQSTRFLLDNSTGRNFSLYYIHRIIGGLYDRRGMQAYILIAVPVRLLSYHVVWLCERRFTVSRRWYL